METEGNKIGRITTVPAGHPADRTTLCLGGNRFRVTANWQSPTAFGQGQGFPLTSDTGYFWFFSANNVELVVKIFNGKFWVFYGALSDVEYTITVTDAATGTVKTYFNQAGTLASIPTPLPFSSA